MVAGCNMFCIPWWQNCSVKKIGRTKKIEVLNYIYRTELVFPFSQITDVNIWRTFFCLVAQLDALAAQIACIACVRACHLEGSGARIVPIYSTRACWMRRWQCTIVRRCTEVWVWVFVCVCVVSLERRIKRVEASSSDSINPEHRVIRINRTFEVKLFIFSNILKSCLLPF